MKKTTLRILNPVIGLLVIAQASTGLLGDKLPAWIPPATHEAGGILLVAGVVLHVALNFGWVRNNYFGRTKVKV